MNAHQTQRRPWRQRLNETPSHCNKKPTKGNDDDTEFAKDLTTNNRLFPILDEIMKWI